MSNFDTIEEKLNLLIKQLKPSLPEVTVIDAQDFVEHGEYGVALELICQQLFEFDCMISRELYNQIAEVASLMQMPSSTFDFLKGSTE